MSGLQGECLQLFCQSLLHWHRFDHFRSRLACNRRSALFALLLHGRLVTLTLRLMSLQRSLTFFVICIHVLRLLHRDRRRSFLALASIEYEVLIEPDLLLAESFLQQVTLVPVIPMFRDNSGWQLGRVNEKTNRLDGLHSHCGHIITF